MRLATSILISILWACSTRADTPPIQQWIDEAIKQGGGVVTIPPGVHVLEKGLMLKDAKKLSIRGMGKEECVLKLPPLAYAESAKAASAGAKELQVRSARGWRAGMRLHIEADGAIDSFTHKPKPYVLAVVQEVADKSLQLKEPLAFPIPEGAVIRHEDAPNLVEIRGASEQIEIANLTLDGGSVADSPPVQGHAQLCGVFAAGPYSYEKGPTGAKVGKISIHDCILQNLFGRGVAFYSVEQATIERCSIRDTHDEAVDFDHFTTDCVAKGNQIIRCRVAFEINDANKIEISGNEIRDCGLGVNVWRWCHQPGLNEDNTIANNLFEKCGGNAIQFGAGTARNSVEENEIIRPGKNGIVLAGDKQTVRQNKIEMPGGKAIVINGGEHDIDSAESR